MKELTNDFISSCTAIVNRCGVQVLIINYCGLYKAYLTSVCRLPNKDCPYGEVVDGKDITTVVQNFGSNFISLSREMLEQRTQSVCKESFQFGTNDYIWITRVEVNE